MAEPFPLTRDAALVRWRAFMPTVTRYGVRRNFVTATHAEVSRLSPAIRFGLITPEEIVRETIAEHDPRGVEKWLREICWRSYWKGWLEMRPQAWRSWRQRLCELRASMPDGVLARAQEVSEGRSGVAVMDHFARELRETGYLHNHARMWWASFWIHADDLCLESSPLASLRPAAVAAFTSDGTSASDGLSPLRIQSLHTEHRDGLMRAGAHFDCATGLSDTPSTAEGLKAWVESEKLDAVIAMFPHIGPVADALPSIGGVLGAINVPLHLVRRPWDAHLFPSAKAGFFPFWEKTSRWLAGQLPPARTTPP